MHYLKKLKTILQSKYLFKFILIICIFYAEIIFFYFPQKSKYTGNEKEIIGIVTNLKEDGDHLTLEIKEKEKLIAHYYFKTKKEKQTFLKQIELGTKIKIIGTLNQPTNNTIPNIFNYKEYLKHKGIFFLIQANKIEILSYHQSLFYQIKNIILNRIDKIDKTGYLRTFILGDKTIMDQETISKYQENGISHLFSISGMHISFIVTILLFLLNKITYHNKSKYGIISIFLIFYLFLTGNSASITRTTIMFILFSINKCFNLKIKSIDLLLCLLSISIIIDTNLIFDIGFQFSYVISTAIILSQKKISKLPNRYKSIYISLLSFIVSFPISIYHFQKINYLSILFNLVMIPLISTIIFPATFLVLIFSNLYPIYEKLIFILEKINAIFYYIPYGKIIFCKPNILMIILYYLLIILSIYKKKYYILLGTVILIHYQIPTMNQNLLVTFLDVGQGDSIFIKLPHNQGNILIDTGGKIEIPKEKWAQNKNKTTLTTSRIIPYLHSMGIKKLDYLILSHGDYDHMGESINLVNHFKINKVIFNCGSKNDLEQKLINVLHKKGIEYRSCIKKINVDRTKLYFLNTKEYNNENDNSNVIYLNYNNYQFLFMGDAGIDKEKDLLDQYNLKNIDFFKVGHHGSNTSSSKYFIDKIKPKYSFISVGKNNRYGHPKETVLNILTHSKIYRTDQDGSIEIKINKTADKIKIYSP